MTEKLSDFLIDLATDPDRMSRFAADPEGELDRAGLTADERAAVLTRDSSRLRRALHAGPADTMTFTLKHKPGPPKPRPPKPGAKRKPTRARRGKGKGKGR